MPKSSQPRRSHIDGSEINSLITFGKPSQPEHTARVRALWYLVTAGILLFAHAFSLTIPIRGTPELYTILQVIVILLSAIVCAMALIKYTTRHLYKYLLIGAGFLLTAGIAGLDLLSLFQEPSYTHLHDISFWTQARFVLSVFAFASLISARFNKQILTSKWTLAGPLLGAIGIIAAIQLVPNHMHGIVIILTAIFFLSTSIGYILKEQWTYKYFEHWFIISLFIFSYAEFVRLSSIVIFDTPMIIAHVLTIAATMTTLIGLLMSMFIAFRQVEEAGNKIQTILTSIGEGVIVIDRVKRVIATNSVAEQLTGYTLETLSKTHIEDSIIIQDKAGLETLGKAVQQAYTERTTIFHDHQILKGYDSTTVHVSYSVAPIIEHPDELIGLVLVIHDSTNEHELEQTKDNFLSVVAHQLRTPLGAIRWNLELLLSDDFGRLTKKMRRPIEDSYQNNHRMINLVNDLLNVLRIEQKRLIDNPKQTDVYTIVQDICHGFRYEAMSRNITLTLSPKSSIPMPIHIDPERLTEVVENMISNAIKYNKDSGTIDVLLSVTPTNYTLTFKDTGIGIPKDDQKSLFTRFFRASNSSIRNTTGSGLGLFVVQSYVEGWGGSVSMHSKVNSGTRFEITIPKHPMRLTPSTLKTT